MALSDELISAFVEVTNDQTETKQERTVYGTIIEHDGTKYVQLDGSDMYTPISTTSSVKVGDRVMVLIKNHTATVTGNTSDPSASSETVKHQGDQISEFEIIIAYKVKTDDLEAINATIESLRATTAKLENMEAINAEIDKLEARLINADHLTATDIEAVNAEIEHIEAMFGEFTDISAKDLEAINADIGQLKAYTAEFTYVSAEVLEAMKANIKQLDADKLSAAMADITYANIDFANIGEAAIRKIFSDTGLIKDLIVGDTTITGELVGVTLKGDLIEAGTLKADRLVVKGSDGNYYKLNTDFEAMPGVEPVEDDTIHGSVLIKKSITAEKISVKDLVAFGATIGGFEITNDSIRSLTKDNVHSGINGIYMDRDGQVAFGGARNFIKYYKDTDGSYRLEIRANNLLIGADEQSIDDIVAEKIDDLHIGSVNEIRNSDDLIFENYYFTGDFIVTHDGNGNVTVVCGASVTHDENGNVVMRSATTTTDDGAGNVTTI